MFDRFVQFASVSAALVCAQQTAFSQSCSQSTDNVTVAAGSVHCGPQGTNFHTENSYIRRYDSAVDCGQASGQMVGGVTFGVELAQGGTGGMQPLEVRIYAIDPAMALTFANMGTAIHTEAIMLMDQNGTLMTVPFAVPAFVPAGMDVVAEVWTPDGSTTMDSFFIGSNGMGESSPSYLAASACGILDPATTASIGFPNMNIILDLEPPGAMPTIGTNYCGPAVANSTGSPGVISAIGDPVAANNAVTLVANSLPNNQFGIFITSMTQGFNPMPGGSAGNLCLSGGIGRFNGPGQIQNSGGAGSISLALDLTMSPTPGGPIAVMSGDTLNYQAWYRDLVGGTPGSNFTDGTSVTYQ